MAKNSHKLRKLPVGGILPEGWLKRQIALANSLQKRLGADASLLENGEWKSGELFPRYVRGLILLAGVTDERLLREKADGYMSAIFESAQAGGDFGPKGKGALSAKIEAVKTLLSYYELTGDMRAVEFLKKFFKNQFNTLGVTPLWFHPRARLLEEIPAIAAVYREKDPEWLKDLAEELNDASCGWFRIANKFPYKKPASKIVSSGMAKRVLRTVQAFETTEENSRKPFTVTRAENEWKKTAHRLIVETDGVNLAKAVKYPCTYGDFMGDDRLGLLSLRFIGALERFHGNATGMFASAERIAGTSPLSPIGVESAVEMLGSLILVLAATGELACADLIEEIVFNVIGAAGTESLSAVQDFLLPNQTEASRANGEFVGGLPSGNPFFGRGVTPGAVALISAYPMFLESLCMTRDDELNFFGYAPCTISTKVNGATLRIKEDTGYPFRNTIVFRVEEAEGEVNLRLNFRVPARTTMQLISGGQVVASGERSISAKCILRTGSTFMLKLNIPLTVSPNRDGSVSLYKGSLLMASRIGEETSASKDGTAAVFASHKWAFAPVLAKKTLGGGLALYDNERTAVNDFTQYPFNHTAPPFELRIKCRNVVNWEYGEDGLAPVPTTPKFSEECVERTFVPFGCTSVRMSHFPPCHRT